MWPKAGRVLTTLALLLWTCFAFPATFKRLKGSVGNIKHLGAKDMPVFLICPGFGNDEVDYRRPLDRGEEVSFVNALARRGIESDVVKIRRFEWLKLLIPSLTNPSKFASNEMTPEILYGFYIAKVKKQVKEIESRGQQVVLVGHSAGGWLVRRIVGEEEAVVGLVTLGTPHFPASVNDATRGALRRYDEELPGAYFQRDQKKFYVSVGGTAVKANLLVTDKKDPVYFTNDAYLAVTGDTDNDLDGRVGDGVVPLDFTLLPGSKQVVLKGVYHSIQAPGDYWYGGESVVDQWLPTVLREIRLYSSSSPSSLFSISHSSSISSSTSGSGRVSFAVDGVGPWAQSVFGGNFMRVFALVVGTGPYAAMILKDLGVFD